ncbi:MAG: two pore domain potassium channel family protein [Deltaproteobacteria bacterium]|nr:two pore domain potassium channel family protein [Deltaproteobacteria bacterium]
MTINDTKKAGLFHRFPWKPVRFVQLFIFIVLIILLSPFLDRTPLLLALLGVFFLNILLVTLSFAGFGVRRRWLLILLWLLGTAMNIVALQSANRPFAGTLEAASDLVSVLLIIICVAMILRFVLTSREVTVDTIFGAVVAYFLIALAFSSLYQALAVIEPGSFGMPSHAAMGKGISLNVQLNYFSFVTIASLGYGDIVPKLPPAQMFAILEAVFGQFYMAVVVAWLVSALSVNKMENGGGKERID